MKLYEHFLNRKQKGELLNLEELSPKDLEKLFINESKSDAMIASLFGLKSSKITYLRRKYGITIRNSLIKNFLDYDYSVDMELNTNMTKIIITNENISKNSKEMH